MRREVCAEAHVRGAVPHATGAVPPASPATLADPALLRRTRSLGAPPTQLAPLPSDAALQAHLASRAAAAIFAQQQQRGGMPPPPPPGMGMYPGGAAAPPTGMPLPMAASAGPPLSDAQRAAAAAAQADYEARCRCLALRRRFCSEVCFASAALRRRHFATTARRCAFANEGVRAWHAKERNKLSRQEARRLQALRANDEEQYLRLVAESKNERLNTLLHKTAELLSTLENKIKATQAAAAAAGEEGVLVEEHPNGAVGEAEGEEGGDGDGDDAMNGAEELLDRRRAYTDTAHAIQERIGVQPALLTGGGTLRHYQLAGVQWMVSLYNNGLNGILADEMGLGKTIQTIALFAYLAENKAVGGPHMIICPKAVLSNWANEFAQWAPSLPVIMYDGRADERAALRSQVLAPNTPGGGAPFCALLTHYDLVIRDRPVLGRVQWNYIVVDEGHRLKNRESKLAEMLGGRYKSRHRLLLTGTPIQNNLTELWALLNFLLPTIFHSAESFAAWFNAPFAGTKEDVSLNDEEELVVISRLHQVLRPFLLRRRKAEVEKELPAKVEVVLKAGLSAWQRRYYSQIVAAQRVGTDATLAGGTLMNRAMQLRKCCNHPYLFLQNTDYTPATATEVVRASGKLELLHRILPKLRAGGHRILLFSQMTKLLDILEEYLVDSGHAYLRLDGNTGTAQRGELLAAFNAPDSPHFIFLLSTRAGGMGLNLQTADTVIMFDSDWNPQADAQAEDRAHRIGQRREVRVIVLVSVGSIEEVIQARARQKRAVDAKVIQAGMFNGQSSADERRAMLASIFASGGATAAPAAPEGADEEEAAAVAGITTPGELNRLLARTDAELELFEEMDEKAAKAGTKPLGLLREDECPAWVMAPPEEDADSDGEGGGGTGARRRRAARNGAVYAEALSDRQWLRIVDDGGDLDDIRAAEEGQRAQGACAGKRRRSGAPAKPRQGRRVDKDGGSEEEAEEESDDEEEDAEAGTSSPDGSTPEKKKQRK